MEKAIPTGLSLPADLFVRIELQRGDIGRSRYILRLIEKALTEDKNQNKKVVGAQVQ
jgi:hypothetical protein